MIPVVVVEDFDLLTRQDEQRFCPSVAIFRLCVRRSSSGTLCFISPIKGFVSLMISNRLHANLTPNHHSSFEPPRHTVRCSNE
jgi:hypothetical protein